MQTRFDSAHLDPKCHRRLGMRQAGQVEEHHGLTLPAGQTGNGAMDLIHQVSFLGCLFRAGVPIDRLKNLAATLQSFPRPQVIVPIPQPAAANVQPDSAQPGTELCRTLQAVKAEQRLKRGLMGGVLGETGIVEHARAQRDEHGPVPAQQYSKRRPVAAAGRIHQCSVTLARVHLGLR